MSPLPPPSPPHNHLTKNESACVRQARKREGCPPHLAHLSPTMCSCCHERYQRLLMSLLLSPITATTAAAAAG